MSTFQQKALVPFYFPVDFDVTTTADDFTIASSITPLAPYAKPYLAGAVPKAFQATLHSVMLFCSDQVSATSMTVAITDGDEAAQMQLTTCPFIEKSGAAGSGVCRSDSPVTTIWVLGSDGELSIRLATNAGTLTVTGIIMVFEFHQP